MPTHKPKLAKECNLANTQKSVDKFFKNYIDLETEILYF
jgi:hypothetical protein